MKFNVSYVNDAIFKLGKQLPPSTHKENRDISAIYKTKNLILGSMDREFNFIVTFYGQMWPPFICP